MFIRGLNAVYAQALTVKDDKIKAFAFFCNSLITMIHHHHHMEETMQFPFFETKLGAGSMEHNVEQHHAFLGGFDDLGEYVKGVLAGTVIYDGNEVIAKLDTFADTLVQHLHDELPTLESSKLRAMLTKKDLTDLEASLGKRILKEVSLTNVLPLGLVLHDKASAPHFPPLPAPILWIARHVFYHLHGDAWAFGPCDVYGKLKPGLGNDTPAA
ncbi:hypothetical protein C0991_007795 [Blastosporella zonata]|nr:hypothetical protein C0991_007795 [Blastosporella zonata]